MSLQLTIFQIESINEILISIISNNIGVDFNIAHTLFQFYLDCQNTNSIIDEAEKLAEEDPQQLKELARILGEKSAQLIENLKLIKEIDFINIADKHTSLFYDRFQKAADELNPYWKKYCEFNNRLDYLPLESKEYKAVEKKCEKAKGEHDKRQIEVKKLYADYQKEQKKAADLYALKIPYLLAVTSKINIISGSIIADIERMEKEGQI